mgnify:CR=1 FL=1
MDKSIAATQVDALKGENLDAPSAADGSTPSTAPAAAAFAAECPRSRVDLCLP